MKIHYQDPDKKPDDLGESVASSLSYTWSEGLAEAASEIAIKNSKAIGKLIDLLTSKGVLSTEEAAGFLDFRWSSDKFEIKP